MILGFPQNIHQSGRRIAQSIILHNPCIHVVCTAAIATAAKWVKLYIWHLFFQLIVRTITMAQTYRKYNEHESSEKAIPWIVLSWTAEREGGVPLRLAMNFF
jgi:hypothetical protein